MHNGIGDCSRSPSPRWRFARFLTFSVLLSAAPAPFSAHGQSIPVHQEPPQDPAPLLADNPPKAKIDGSFELAVLGDLLYTNPIVDGAGNDLKALFRYARDADFALGNLESPMASLATPGLSPAGNGMLLMNPAVAGDLGAMGVDMVSLANNHMTDWGEIGVLESIRLLDKAQLPHAGAGPTRAEAYAARYADTPKGRVAMVATASTFKESAMANDAIQGMPARPGISVIRTRRITLVSEPEMAVLRGIAARHSAGRRGPPTPTATELSLGDESYRVSDRTGYTYAMNPYDRYAVLKAIHDADATADLTVFTIHAHESAMGGSDDDDPVPADFLPPLFHDAVDAGADIVVGGGPHALRGIEIYKGRPIFYGVGVFLITGDIYASQELQQDIAASRAAPAGQPMTMPTDVPRAKGGNPRSWYDGVISLVDYEDGKARRVRLVPLDLRPDDEYATRGLPRLARGDRAREVLTHLQNDSRMFGTNIKIEGSTGVIDIP